MRRWGNKPGLIALAAGCVALALPAFGQDAPESILPPGFGTPAAPPAAAPPPATAPGGAGEEGVADLPDLPLVVPDAATTATAADAGDGGPEELPDAARRPVDIVGPLGPDDTGLGYDAYGNANGRFLTTMMRRLDAPLASRWASILLRRALLSRVPAPAAVNPVDWVAERAWLLLRMGEADGARLLVQSVDVDAYTPRMYAVAAQVALATADPAALCPLADVGTGLTDEPIWPLAQAMCAGLSGDSATAGLLLDQARGGRRDDRDIDLLLAERIVGAGVGARRVVAVDWSAASRLTAWRFGLASAAGVAIPDELWQTAGPQVEAWRARLTRGDPADRLMPARIAAALGVLSSANLVDLYGVIADGTDPMAVEKSPAGQLGLAYAGDGTGDRIAALRKIWATGTNARDSYGATIATARAAARIAPDEAYAGDAAKLLAAMLSAGLDRQAARWSGIVGDMSAADGDAAWALLAVGAPRPVVDTGLRRVTGFVGRAGQHRGQILVAALAGLGRLSAEDAASLAQDSGIALDAANRWTKALEVASARDQPATVALLAAAGLQTRSWSGVPPAYLYHILQALRATGHDPEARMIAAEAMTRT